MSRGRTILVAATALAALTTAVTVSRWAGDQSASPPPTSGLTAAALPVRVAATQRLLANQAASVDELDRVGYLAGWSADPAAQRVGATTYDGLSRLGVASWQPRLVSPTAVTGSQRAWTAEVQVIWSLQSEPTRQATAALHYRFSTSAGRPAITGVTVAGGATMPVWLLPGLTVRHTPRTLVAGTDPAAARRVAPLLRRAVSAVGAVLPGWRGSLVLYAPATADQFGRLIGADATQYRGIAAVTTTVDGSRSPLAAVAIVLNPTVFAGLSQVGAQVVVVHEATHQATGAATVSMPLWVAEGFADYVGIGSVDLPVSVAGQVALRLVRRDGPPLELPSDAAFDQHGPALEAAYEEAWFATSLIARRHGPQTLVRFYRDVEAHPTDVSGAFQRDLHTSPAAFTAAWQTRLRVVAGDG